MSARALLRRARDARARAADRAHRLPVGLRRELGDRGCCCSRPSWAAGATIAAAALLLTVVPLTVLFRSRGSSHYPGKAIRLFVFRPMWYAQLLLILCALGGLVARSGGLPFGAAGRAGRDAIALIAIVYTLFALLGYAGSRRLVVASLTVTLPSLPEALDGLRIAQICDTHIGPHTSRAQLAALASAVRGAKPDLIAVVGDLIDDFAPDVEHLRASARRSRRAARRVHRAG